MLSFFNSGRYVIWRLDQPWRVLIVYQRSQYETSLDAVTHAKRLFFLLNANFEGFVSNVSMIWLFDFA